jgi:hypothetical protein
VASPAGSAELISPRCPLPPVFEAQEQWRSNDNAKAQTFMETMKVATTCGSKPQSTDWERRKLKLERQLA